MKRTSALVLGLTLSVSSLAFAAPKETAPAKPATTEKAAPAKPATKGKKAAPKATKPAETKSEQGDSK
jgi:hypothetical protein